MSNTRRNTQTLCRLTSSFSYHGCNKFAQPSLKQYRWFLVERYGFLTNENKVPKEWWGRWNNFRLKWSAALAQKVQNNCFCLVTVVFQ